jgi:ATPase subunit of ABC transporter with duplicated ATPase domains
MAIIVNELEYGYPGTDSLFFDVSFKVETGMVAGLIGDNAVGKSTLLRVIAGELEPDEGTVVFDGSVLRMPQSIGQTDEPVSVKEFLAALSGDRAAAAAARLMATEQHADGSAEAGMELAEAIADWSDMGGFELEAVWDACTTRVLRQPLAKAAGRPITELSGGERKRLALEMLLRSDAAVLLLDEPDNFLDIPAKRWLEAELAATKKTVLIISHDRELLSRVVTRLVTIEGSGAWTHPSSFRDYHEARERRNTRLGSALQRWQDAERRLYRHMKVMKQRAATNDKNAPKADAAETRWRKFVDAGPPPAPPPERTVSMRLTGADSGRRVIRCTGLEIDGLTEPFSVDVYFGERVAVLGPNGSGKSHFLRLLAGDDSVERTGSYRLGARVDEGLFVQTNQRPEYARLTVAEVVAERIGNEETMMRTLARYGLHGTANRRFVHLSGGQQARLQVLMLELSGVNLLLLDEPTDNLDLVSAEALQEALATFTGTVLAVTHDRWFMRSFDRYLMFDLDGAVAEAMDLATALGLSMDSADFVPGPGSLRSLVAAP